MPWKAMDVQDQRVRFVVAASLGEKPLSQLCVEFGVSRPTGYLRLDRYREGGVAAIAERSQRPHCSPDKTADELEQRVVLLRQCYPDWGVRKLRVLLDRRGIRLPASTIHRILLRHDLVREAERKTKQHCNDQSTHGCVLSLTGRSTSSSRTS
jgi:transposase